MAHVRARSLVAVTAVVMMLGCVPRPYFCEYLSFEQAHEAEVVDSDRIGYAGVMWSKSVPTRYRIGRAKYEIFIAIDPTNPAPNATIRIAGPDSLSIVPRSEEATKPSRARSCGAYEIDSEDSSSLEFYWTNCGHDAELSEFVVRFDVVENGGGTVGTERIPFQLARGGLFWGTDAI